ncbi:MAG: hypothetical protein QM639_05970 [Rhodocyclaceae bacterium]
MNSELLKCIKEILLHDWDPIMIGENHLLDDEYDNYALEIYKLFVAGKSSHEALYDYLLRTEDEAIGMSIEDEKREKVVDKLLCLK